MHKIITLFSRKSFQHCQECFDKEWARYAGLRHLGALQTFVLPQEHMEALLKHVGKAKYMVSENITIKLHAATDEIPWGVKEIGAPAQWERTKGKGIRVAVLDTGISRNHPDLKGQVKGGAVLVDSSGGGNGHGTHVAGTIAAAMNNKGIVGVAPDVELYDVRVFASDGTAQIADIVDGINWAIENKMHVINMSFGSSEDSPVLRHAIAQAAKAGIIMVASAGNNGGKIEYPAAYKQVIAVGAVDREGKLADFSSRGRKLNTVAPGVDITSTWLKKSYRSLDGTSMAAAHVSGIEALKLARRQNRRG
ncbi:MAG: S8 family peptidase [Clostridia bacterium]